MSVIKRMRVSLVYIIETRVKIERVVKIKRRNSRSMAFQNLILIIMLEKKKKITDTKGNPQIDRSWRKLFHYCFVCSSQQG
jgi:intein/homing endonuclease